MDKRIERLLLLKMIDATSFMDRHHDLMKLYRGDLEKLIDLQWYYMKDKYRFQKKLEDRYNSIDIMDAGERNQFGLFLFDLMKECEAREDDK